MTLVRRAGLHALIGWLLIGMLSSNLENDPLDRLLEPWAGRPFAALGLRQYWAMFAPNPVHNERFVKWVNVGPGGERAVVAETEEPPFPVGSRAWVGLGYTRASKWDKQVGQKSERFGKPTADAYCRLLGLHGSMELTVASYTTPTPAQRLAGTPVKRVESVAGTWPCP